MTNQESNRVLSHVIEGISQLPAKTIRQFKAAAARAALKLVDDEFKRSVDPYGKRWAPWRPSSVRAGKLLVKTGTLRRGFEVAETETGFALWNGVSYFVYHQLGTEKMKARPMLPWPTLPASWKLVFEIAGRRAMDDSLPRKKLLRVA